MASLPFHKYHSIENAHNVKMRSAIECQPCVRSSVEWCVLEKVHGANFSFTTDGRTIIPAKRTDYLTSDDDVRKFFHSDNVVQKYSTKILKLYQLVKEVNKITDSYVMQVFGEIFGGGYFKNRSTLIQKEILYCPHLDFYAYDIYIKSLYTASGDEPKMRKFYMNYRTCMRLFEECAMLFAKPEFFGTYHDALAFSVQSKSQLTGIPKVFGLPDIEGNVREGNIIKPVDPQGAYMNNNRIILKDKNEKFSETKAAPDTQQTSKGEQQKSKASSPLSPALEDAISEASRYVTQQRYNGLISKIGEISEDVMDRAIIAKTAGLLCKDALEDFHKEYDIDSSIKKNDMKKINAEVNRLALILVKSNLYQKYQ